MGDHFALRLDNSGQSGAFFYDGTNWTALTVSETFADEGWHHFAATFDDTNDEFKLYIDGEMVDSMSITGLHISYSGQGTDTVIGRHGNGSDDFDFTGETDDVRVYDYALSAVQIAALFDAGPTTQYKFDCNSNLVKTTDPMGRVTEFEYDELDRLISRTDPDPDGQGGVASGETTYMYNSLGWLTSTTDPEGNSIVYGHDDNGRVRREGTVVGNGLNGRYYQYEGGQLLYSEVDSEVDFPLDPDFAGHDLPDGFFASWTGAIYIDDPGEVTFYLNNTDSAELYIDDFDTALFSNNQNDTSVEDDIAVNLTGGWHTLRIDFADTYYGVSGSRLTFSYDPPGGGKVVVPTSKLGKTDTTEYGYDVAGESDFVDRFKRQQDKLDH